MNSSSVLKPGPAQVQPLPSGHAVGCVQQEPDHGHPDGRRLTTAELAAALSLREQSIRKRLWQTGSYFGVRPVKLPNGKLRWPSDSVARLIAPAKSAFEGSVQ